MTDVFQLYLASASPRRRELLQQIGVRFELISAPIDETPLPSEPPADYVRRLALAKAQAGLQVIGGSAQQPVLGADTTVVIDGEMLGKPESREHGLAMLARLSGREHQVFSAVALRRNTQQRCALQVSRVRLRALSAAERELYWQSGEPADKAGGYAIQGLGASFVAHLQGSHCGVMGLPLFETVELLDEFGINILAAQG